MKKICIFVLLFSLYFITSCNKGTDYVVNGNGTSTVVQTKKTYLIDLKGEVVYPNLYTVYEGTTVYELVHMAGGLSPYADVSTVNLAQVIDSNQMIIIPAKKIEEEKTEQVTKVNINFAGTAELCTLPGIGEAKAKKIIAYREQNGYFRKIEDIKNVSGIGEEIFTKIKPYITV